MKKVLQGLLIFIVVLTATGIVYQTAATEADKSNFPAPGNLIDVGGFKMHIHCMGEGSPTVILEAASGGFSSSWAWVQPEIAEQVRVCAYDRAGSGWSESDAQPESAQRTAENLHTLLTNAGITGPYVMLGHSKGGLYVRQYAALYPQDVAGIVLLDSSHPYQFDRYPELLAGDTSVLQWMPLIKTLLRLGVGHAYFALGGEADFKDLPQRQHDEIAAVWSSVRYWENMEVSMRSGESIFKGTQNLGSLGNLPLLVVSRGTDNSTGWSDMQDDLAALSTNSRHITVENSTHMSLIFDPQQAHILSQAILQLVHDLQAGNTTDL